MKYRGDIDGLRAIAVVSVVLFHFDIIGGGFVGVDIFFVISGYLITKLIHDGVADGTFSIVDFYARRIRRIFPALFAVYAATIAFAFLYCFSFEAEFIGKAILSSLFFVSNVFFYNQSSYFDDGNSVNPLLHTWSLSVEEQVYIVLPLLLILLGTFHARMRTVALAVIAAASFIAACIMVYSDRSAAFYLMQYRGWELLLGSLLAVGAAPPIRTQRTADLIGISGLAMIMVSIALTDKDTPFPGHGALAPCLGACLVIYSGAAWRTPVVRLLNLQPARFVGLISYSLYLWHYPVRVVYQHIWGEFNDTFATLLIAVSFVLAALSWRFIEQPFRRARTGRAEAPIFVAALVSLTVMATIAGNLGTAVRIARDESPQVTAMLDFLKYRPEGIHAGTCFISLGEHTFSDFQPSTCLRIASDKPNVLVFGDSHAAHLWPGLSEIYPQINFLQATASGCRPSYDIDGQPSCSRLADFVLHEFIPSNKLDGVILSARWKNRDDLERIKTTALRLQAQGVHVIVFGPIVEYTLPLPRVLALQYASITDGPGPYRKSDRQGLDRAFSREMHDAGIEYISVYNAICAPDCTVWLEEDKVPLQFDYGHLTKAGSRELARRIGPQFLPLVTTHNETAAAAARRPDRNHIDFGR